MFRLDTPDAAILTLKHVAIAVMIGISLYRSLVVRRQHDPSRPSQERLSVGLVFLNTVLGVLMLLLSGLSAAEKAAPVCEIGFDAPGNARVGLRPALDPPRSIQRNANSSQP